MDGKSREIHRRADSDASGSSFASSRVSRGDDNQILERVKQAFVVCRRWSTIPWLKARTDDRMEELQELEFTSISPTSSPPTSPAEPRRIKNKPRPLLLEVASLRGSAFYNDEAIDPFITSPSWLKTEHTAEETSVSK